MGRIVVTEEVDQAVAPGDTATVWMKEETGLIVTAVEKDSRNRIISVSTRTLEGNILTWETDNGYRFEVTKRAPKVPQHWPPQEEDVWIAGDEVYHMIGEKMYRSANPGTVWSTPEVLLKSCNGDYGYDRKELKLVYRKGNDPNV